MNKIFFPIILLILPFTVAFADEAKNEWRDTTLSDATIKKIQDAKFQYKKCVSDELQKPVHQQQDSRYATDAIMKQCEPVLANMRSVYLAENIPEAVADRHLKQMRIQITRDVLQAMIFAEAARKSGQ